MTLKEAIRRVHPLFWIGVIIIVIGVIDTVIFFVWRWDKPPDNPGGPLISMGGWVVGWEQSGGTLRLLGLLCVLIAVVFRRK
jgi:hypothetical protein